MSIVKEQETKNKIKAKGILTEITDEGFVIFDEKTEEVGMLRFSDFEMFVDKAINFSVADVEKVELE